VLIISFQKDELQTKFLRQNDDFYVFILSTAFNKVAKN